MLIWPILSGVLYFLSFPPYGFWFLIFPALFFFYKFAIENEKSFISGFIFGSVAYGVVLIGIQSIGYEAWIPLMILMGSMYGLFARVLSYVGAKTDNNFFVLVAVVSTFDLIRAYFPFGGFPWGYPSTVLIGDLTKNFFRTYGPIGFSLVIESLVLLLVLSLLKSNKDSGLFNFYYFKYLLIYFFIFGFTFLQATPTVEDRNIEISIIQGNSPCPGAKNKCSNERQRIYDSHLSLTQSLSTEQVSLGNLNPRLIVWAESSSGFSNDPLIHDRVLKQISKESIRLGSYFLIGGDRPIADNYFENYGIFISKATLNNSGEIVGQYLKQHPVPFGEYIPFRRYLEWIPPLSLVPRDMIRGNEEKIFIIEENNIKISPVISFEGSFERYIRRSVQSGAELIVILTNQASYGESGMSDQFILMSRANAISNYRDVVHAAITGKSAFISGINGEVYSSTELFTADTSTEVLNAYSYKTIYSIWGNYLNYIMISLGLIYFLRFGENKKFNHKNIANHIFSDRRAI